VNPRNKTGNRDVQIALVYNSEDKITVGEPHDLIALQDTVNIAQHLYDAITSLGYAAIKIPVHNSLDELRQQLQPLSTETTFIFNICDGFQGKSNGAVQVIKAIEELGFKYTGSSAAIYALCTNKANAKQRLIECGLPTPAFQVFEQPAGNIQIGFPAIVKPVAESASLGIDLASVVKDPEQLLARVAYVIECYQQPALAEVFMPGREFAVSIWGNEQVEVLPISEEDYGRILDPLERLITYEAKWIPESPFFQNIFIRCPAELPPEVEAHLVEICSAAYKAIGLRDFGRIDLRYYNGALNIIDINDNPDLSLASGFPHSAKVGGYPYPEMAERILNFALKREGWRD
jgi:D-alanine-D-alanine ligase